MSDATTTLTLRLNSAGDWEALKQARANVEELRNSLEAVRTTLSAFGVGFGAAFFAEYIRGMNEAGAATVRLAEQAHISTEAFQALSYVAIDAGMNQQDLASKLEFLNKSMGLAAEGSSKQNLAIADLGLNTAELLAMPVEQQLATIAKGYVDAADKGRAWADVIVLLGRGAAGMQQIITQVGSNGAPAHLWWMPTDADLQKLREQSDWLDRLGAKITGIWQIGRAHMGTGFNPAEGYMHAAGLTENQEWTGGAGHYKSSDAPAAPSKPTADDIRAEMAATLEALPAMQAAHRELAKALQDEAGAYQSSAEKAFTLRQEAAQDEAESAKLKAGNVADFASQVEAEKLLAEASKLRAQANKVDAEQEKKDQQELIKESEELYKAKVKEGDQAVSNLERQEQGREKLNAVAMVSIERDWNATDNQKWEEKKALLESNIAALQRYIDEQNAIANDPRQPGAVQDKARNAAGRAGSTMAGAEGQLGALGPDPTSFTQNFSKDLTALQNQWGTLQQNMASGLTGVIGSAMTSVSSNIDKLIMGTETWRKALGNIVATIEGSVVSTFVQMGVKWVATQIMMAVEGKAIAAASAAAMIPIATAESAIWAAPATLATIASWGGAAAGAPMEILAAMAGTQALAGFSQGGYTGEDGGIVHPKEYVFSAPAVQNIGVANLESAHQMAKGGGSGAQAPSSSPGMTQSFHMHADYNSAFRAAMRDPSNKKTILDTHRMAARHV